MEWINLAIAPIAIILVYIYIRDKYEKEPWSLMFLGLFFGAFISVPIIFVEEFLDTFSNNFADPSVQSLYIAFIVAAFSEETFKFIILYVLVWHNKNFNEKFDGIVYAVFVSLGFALVENILYVISPDYGGVYTGIMRSIFAVPAHGLFGIAMGYYLAMSKFEKKRKTEMLGRAYFIPIIFHGLYDFILVYQNPILLVGFIPFLLYMWVTGFRKMKAHIQESPFKTEDYY